MLSARPVWTEIIAFSDRAREFEELNTQLIAASTDTPEVGCAEPLAHIYHPFLH